jgi:predicted Zn-dependent protease
VARKVPQNRFQMKKKPLAGVLIKKFAIFNIATALCLSLPAAAQLPTLGDGNELSVAAERRMGERIVREIYRDPDYLDDPVLADYMQSLWRPLLRAARERGDLSAELSDKLAWEIMLARDRSINAFALPGGYLGVHLGLIGLTANRDELASVLAHELSHVTQRHIARLIAKQNQQTPLVIGAMILGAIAASKSPDAANAAIVGGQALAAQTQLNFSRDMEREADRVGFGVLQSAGFDPRGFAGMFDKLQMANRINDNGSFPYLRSHPLTTERIADMQARVPGGKAGPVGPLASLRTAPDAEHALMAARARVLADPRIEAQRAWVAEAQAGNLAQLSPLRQAAVLYAGALAASRQREHAMAQSLFLKLKTALAGAESTQSAIKLLASELALNAGDAPRAVAQFGAPEPLASSRAAVLLLSQAQTQTGRTGAVAAAERLQLWVGDKPRDAQAWMLLSQAQAAAGQPLRAVRSEAEARVALLDYTAALDRYKAAQDMMRRGGVPADHVEASIIDTRLRQVEQTLREQLQEERNAK